MDLKCTFKGIKISRYLLLSEKKTLYTVYFKQLNYTTRLISKSQSQKRRGYVDFKLDYQQPLTFFLSLFGAKQRKAQEKNCQREIYSRNACLYPRFRAAVFSLALFFVFCFWPYARWSKRKEGLLLSLIQNLDINLADVIFLSFSSSTEKSQRKDKKTRRKRGPAMYRDIAPLCLEIYTAVFSLRNGSFKSFWTRLLAIRFRESDLECLQYFESHRWLNLLVS